MQTALSDLLVCSMCGLSGNKLLMLSLASLRLWSHWRSFRNGSTLLTWFSDETFRSAEISRTFRFTDFFFFSTMKMVVGSKIYPFKIRKSL